MSVNIYSDIAGTDRKPVGFPYSIAVLGDSLTVRDHITLGATNAEVYHAAASVGHWLRYLLRGRVRFVNIDEGVYTGDALGGKSGDDIAEATARWEDAVAPHVTSSDALWIRLGINNLLEPNDFATMKAEMLALLNKAKRAFKTTFVSGVQPTNNLSTQAYAEAFYAYNQWLWSYCQADESLIYVPCGQSWITDNSGEPGIYSTDVSADGTHQTNLGAYLLAREAFPVFDKVVPEMELPWIGSYTSGYANGGGAILNPLMTGDTSGLADDWQLDERGSCTAVTTKVARTDFPNSAWQQLAVTGDATHVSPAADRVGLQDSGGITTGFSVGDRVQFMAEFEMDAAPTNFGGVSLYTSSNTNFYIAAHLTVASAADTNWGNISLDSGVLITEPATIPSGVTTLYPQIRLHTGDASASFTCRIGRFCMVPALY